MSARTSQRAEYAVLARILEAEREKAGLGQSELARRLGKRQAYVWKIENARQAPDLIEIFDIARVLGIDPKAIVTALQSALSGK